MKATKSKYERYMNRYIIPILKAQNKVYGPLDYLFLTNLIKKNRVKKILDIGTGEGTFVLGLAKKTPKAKFLAIDASRDLINYAHKNKSLLKDKQVTFDCRHFDKTFSVKGFDLIIARFAVEHAGNIGDFIKAVYQKLGPRGRFAIIEYYIDDASILDPVWKEFRRREMALYKKIKAHPRLGAILLLSLRRHGFKNISSSLIQISPSTVGAVPFYNLVKASGQVYTHIDPVNWPRTFIKKLNVWCGKMSKRKDTDPMLLLTHTVGQKP